MQKGSRAHRENQGARALQDKLVPKGRKVAKEKRAMWGVRGKKGSLEKLAGGASEARQDTGPRGAPADTRATQVMRGWRGPRAHKDPTASRG